jgi:protein-S-isoprenylcysteine O-methyltransferase Ste14
MQDVNFNGGHAVSTTTKENQIMKRLLAFTYGTASYTLFLATFLYAIAFLGNVAVTRTIDGEPQVSFGQALLINTLLLGLFAVQHSVMARPAFKRWWTRWVPKPVERSTYVLFSSAALLLLFHQWQPMGGVVWDVQNPIGRGVLTTLFASGWIVILVATFLINHFDLFGLRQVWLYLRGQEYTPLEFTTPGLYRYVRHPLYVGWLLAFWATPTMTVAHLVFAMATTAYILIAIQFEERDLVDVHGQTYAHYRQRVPMLMPRLGRNTFEDANVESARSAAV